MFRVAMIPATALLASGVAIGTSDMHNAGASIAAVVAVCSAFVWMGRMIWLASQSQAQMMERLRHQTERLDSTVVKVTEFVADATARLNDHADKLAALARTVASIDARCQERDRTCPRAANPKRPQ